MYTTFPAGILSRCRLTACPLHTQVSPLDPNVAVKTRFSLWTAFGRLMPIWLTVLLLLITRIPQLQIKGILQSYVHALVMVMLVDVQCPTRYPNTVSPTVVKE